MMPMMMEMYTQKQRLDALQKREDLAATRQDNRWAQQDRMRMMDNNYTRASPVASVMSAQGHASAQNSPYSQLPKTGMPVEAGGVKWNPAQRGFREGNVGGTKGIYQTLNGQDIGFNPSAAPPLTFEQKKELKRTGPQPKQRYGIMRNETTGAERPYTYGNNIPVGWTVKNAGGINVNVGGPNTQKGTKRALEKDIIGGAETLGALESLNQTYDPSFSTYAARGKAWSAEQASKFGINLDNKFLQKYSNWEAQTKKMMFAYRKMVTGVAGGDKEMKAIEDSYINTTDSAIRYKAKVNMIRNYATALMKRKNEFLSKGINLENMTKKERADAVRNTPLSQYGFKQEPLGEDFWKKYQKIQ
jgi:hypothetical protein